MFVVYFVYQLFRVIEFLYIFAVFTLIAWVLLTFDITEMSSDEKLISVDFEVFGKVQGVFFRKYTEQQAKLLELRGYCMNTRQLTVKGVIQGNPSKVAQMRQWLQKVGSPASRIDKAVFSEEKNITKFAYDSFQIKR